MRPPRTLFVALASTFAMAFSPAIASEPETVTIQLDLDAAPTAIYESIREQAWAACKPDTGSAYINARTTARRACQKDMIAQVVKQLPNPGLVQLAQQDGIRTES